MDDGDRESIRSTYLEIVNQALSGVAGALSARARTDVACEEGHEASPVPGGRNRLLVRNRHRRPDVPGAWRLQQDAGGGARQRGAGRSAEAGGCRPREVRAGEISKPTAIDLLLDVELPVSVSFGRAQLALKDVIKLTTGSIVELNRAVSEPVDVIVNNCVIARGDVVVVEGNFGVRIRQVISRQERLRTLY